MKKIVFSFLILALLLSCKTQPQQQESDQQNAAKTNEELQSQSDELTKSMDNLDEAMNLASQLNERIQLVEKRFQDGEISRKHADELIASINKRYGKDIASASETDLGHVFPEWLEALNISEPQGLTYDAATSFQTNEKNLQDGYNSVLFIYNGSYQQAMNEADRIAKAAGISLTETYKKAREVSKRLGKEIAGIKGVTYMNYKLGSQDFSEPYKISINVDEKGKFTLNVVDVKTKKEKEASSVVPKSF